MKIKSMRDFRTWFKTVERSSKDATRNEHFVGFNHIKPNKEKEFGFFDIYHGQKPNITNFLMDGLKNAQDGQAIYEFIQNAADCNSTYFAIFYNEDYFLVINNGEPFSQNDIISILNVGQSSKSDETGQAVDCSKIGRFGIGFKLVHRLVGENDGKEELTEDYKGPVVFSWSKPSEIANLREMNEYQPFEYGDDAPYLFKILITNFPTQPNETVRDIKYKEQVLFSDAEFNRFLHFFKTSTANLDFDVLNRGSMFFLELGKGKRKHLDAQYDSLINGIKCGMNNLKTIKTVFIQDTLIEKLPLKTIDFVLPNTEITKPEDKLCPVKISFGYLSDYKIGKNELKGAPNFYKYFPMSRETHGLNFVLHASAFRIKTDRTQFEEDTDSTNTSIFKQFWVHFETELQNIKNINSDEFRNIYANLLISEPLLDQNANKKWFYQAFYLPLLDFLQNNAPTKNNTFQSNCDSVKINNLKIKINLNDVGLGHIDWFYWQAENDVLLTTEAISSQKLGLEIWDIRDIIENADLQKLNEWIAEQDEKDYDFFFEELNKSDLRKATKARLNSLKLFKFSNHNFYSINDVKGFSNVFFTTPKIEKISEELQKIGFITSEKNISNYRNIYTYFENYLPSDKVVFDKIANNLIKNTLETKEKQQLFSNLITEKTKFDNVGDSSLSHLVLFSNTKNDLKPLATLLNSNLKTPDYLADYKINATEYYTPLAPFLMSEKDIYAKIILPNWADITVNITDITAFYESVKRYFDLSDNKTPFSTQAFIYTNEAHGFQTQNFVFYNKISAQLSNYTHFQNAVFSASNCLTPHKSVLSYLADAPFSVENDNFETLKIIENTVLDLDEIKILLSFCDKNRENFFQYCFIERQNDLFLVGKKTANIRQIAVPQGVTNLNLPDNFKILPSDFSSYKNNNPYILSGEEFYSEFLDYVDYDDFDESLIDKLAYAEPRRKFLLRQNEIRLCSTELYTKESFVYKLLAFASDTTILQKQNYTAFRNLIVIENEAKTLKLKDIPSFSDKVVVDKYTLSLAKILPHSYKNGGVLSIILDRFIDLSLDKVILYDVFGIATETDIETVFKDFSENHNVLENEVQLAFAMLYNHYIHPLDFEKISVETLDGNHHLGFHYYTKPFSFIDANAILSTKYKDLHKILPLPFVLDNEKNTQIVAAPYFTNTEFVCHYLTETLQETEQIDLLDFIFTHWKTSDKANIKAINWSQIGETTTLALLGFDPNTAVYPNEFALESEQIPAYIQDWFENEPEKLIFLQDLGISTANATVVSLRSFFKNDTNFSSLKISEEPRFENGCFLLETLLWLKTNEITANTAKKQAVLHEIVSVFNEKCTTTEIVASLDIDIKTLKSNSTALNTAAYAEWQTVIDSEFEIFIYEGEMPKLYTLDEVENYVFYTTHEGDFYLNPETDFIYINTNFDIKRALRALADDESTTFTLQYFVAFTEATSLAPEVQTLDITVLMTKLDTLLAENIALKARLEAREASLAAREVYDLPAASNPTTTDYDADFFQQIREKSEAFTYELLQTDYPNETVIWQNENGEAFAPYDFEIQAADGTTIAYIDCKGTPKDKRTFYMTANEWRFFLKCLENGINYQIYRIFGVENEPRPHRIPDLWQALASGAVVPYLPAREHIDGGKVFLTIL